MFGNLLFNLSLEYYGWFLFICVFDLLFNYSWDECLERYIYFNSSNL